MQCFYVFVIVALSLTGLHQLCAAQSGILGGLQSLTTLGQDSALPTIGAASGVAKGVIALRAVQDALTRLEMLGPIVPSPVRPTTDLIRKYGYPAEAHSTVTDDGYILRLDRIPRPGAPAILVTNPLTSSSAVFCVLGPGAFAFMLYNAGYDVWLGNFRGVGLSRNHTRYTADEQAFWNFSWHEHGTLDVPAMMDYIQAKNRQTSILYSGHSMGATAFFVMTATRPGYARRVRAAFLMGAAASLAHHRSPVITLAQSIVNATRDFVEKFGPRKGPEVVDYKGRALVAATCRSYDQDCGLFQLIVDATAGPGHAVVPADFQYYIPSGVSLKELIHYVQVANPNWPGFRYYDHGRKRNRELYGQDHPPEYDLSRNTVPVYVYRGATDIIVTSENLRMLTLTLRNLRKVHLVKVKKFGHVDFVFNPAASENLYRIMIADMASSFR